MNIQNTISDELKIARKNQNKELVSTLSFLLGEISIIGKNKGNRYTNDTEAVNCIKKLISSNETMLHKKPELEAENKIFEKYLPKQLTEDEIVFIIKEFVVTNNIKPEGKSLGLINNYFKNSFDGQYEPKLVSENSKKILGI